VHCHRDPQQVIASTAQMQEIFHSAYGADHVGLDQIGRNALLSAHSWESNLAQRANLNPAQILDVDYAEICSDLGGVVARILGRRGSRPSAETLEAVAGWEQENPQHRHGTSTHSLERYGLTPRHVDEAFATYTAFFAKT
jgi:hypothetical protein